MKYLIVLLILLTSSFTVHAVQSSEDSLLLLAASGRITSYDTLMNPIPLDSLTNFFYSYSVTVNDVWTRPAFIDNFYQKGIDGVRMKWIKNFERTSSQKFGKEFIVFNIINIDEYGKYQNTKPAFLIKRFNSPIKESDIRMAEMGKLSSRKQDHEIYRTILNSNNENWCNDEIIIYHIPYKFDSCQYQYTLKLNADLTFSQSYNGNTECSTKEMFSDKGAGIEGDMTYAHVIQNCIINNPEGIWTIEGKKLVFKTPFGVPVFTLWLKLLEDNRILLNDGHGQVCILKRAIK